jgi:hypothetical protein
MKLISASLVEQIDSFLHAGYISAYPRALEPGAYPLGSSSMGGTEKLTHQIDMVQALTLGEPATDAGTNGLDAYMSLINSGDSHGLVIGILAITGISALLYLINRDFRDIRPKLARVVTPIALAAMFLSVTHCKDIDPTTDPAPTTSLPSASGLPTSPPWEGVSKKSYVHPEQATLAILHGIIVPAIANIGESYTVDKLANLKNEVAVPMKNPSEGVAYALKTYGIDGYGNEFKFEYSPSSVVGYVGPKEYKVTSAGADGALDTADDIVASVSQTTNSYWGHSVQHAYYLVARGDQVDLLFHRWNGKMFKYHNEALAKEITGSTLFDVMTVVKDGYGLSESQGTAIKDAFATESEKVDHTPVVLQVFES